MKEDNDLDRSVRKSVRQRVPNPLYTEGINELKKAPRPSRDPPQKQSRKRSIVFQQGAENSDDQPMDQGSELVREINGWFPCKLPKTGTIMKVQFVLNQPQEPIAQKKKEQPPKAVKKVQAFDLLSLFQKAIENVSEQKPQQKEPQNEVIVKEIKIKRQQSFSKQKRSEDPQGKITTIQVYSQKLIVTQSKLGQIQFPVIQETIKGEPQNQSDVTEFRERLLNSNILSQISIFN